MKRIKTVEKASIGQVTPISPSFYKALPQDFVVTEVNGNVVGYAEANVRMLRNTRMEGHILDIAVDPHYRRQGVGKALFEHFVAAFRRQGLQTVGPEVKRTIVLL